VPPKALGWGLARADLRMGQISGYHERQKQVKEMENNANQLELFESSDIDSKKAEYDARIAKAKAEKLETDNALRNGTLVYASKAEDSFRRIINIVYGTLQMLLSETLPYDLSNFKTTGEIRDGLVNCYNEIIRKGQEALEAELRNENDEPVA